LQDLVSTDGMLTPVDTGDVCVNYDKEWFASRDIAPPATLEDLAKPEYKDLLVVQNPNSSSPGLAFMMATIAAFGEEGWQDFWSSLRDNGVKIVDGWTEAYTVEFSGSSGKGNYPLVVSYASSPPAEVVYADPPIDTPPTGVLTETCFRQVEFAGVLAGADEPEAARKLVDFLSGPVFQSDLPLTLFVNPVHPDAEIPEVFTSFAATPESPFTLEPSLIEDNRSRWIEEWSAVAL
jgi:thiamine transport system substrate-binding protein